MTFNNTYFFFLIITMFGAFFTIKICTAAYGVYDVSDPVGIQTAPHHAGIVPVTEIQP